MRGEPAAGRAGRKPDGRRTRSFLSFSPVTAHIYLVPTLNTSNTLSTTKMGIVDKSVPPCCCSALLSTLRSSLTLIRHLAGS